MLFNSESSVSNTSTTSTTSVSNLKTWDGQDYSAAIFLKNINTFSKAMRWKSALYDDTIRPTTRLLPIPPI